MAAGTTNLREQILTTLYVGIVQITGSRHSQSAMPYHKLIVLLVAHLFLAIIRRTVKQVLVESLFLGNRRATQNLVHTGSNTLVGTVGIVGVQNAEW